MKVLIIGGGVAGYFAALKYKNTFKNYQIDLIQTKSINIIGVGESSLLDIPKFLFEDCGLNIDYFHQEVNPTFKLGLQTKDWHRKGETINYAFDLIDQMYKYDINFLDHIDHINHSFFSILMNKRKPPITINNELIVGETHETPYFHAYQIENKKFIPYLQQQAKIKGIHEIEGQITNIEHENNVIKSVYFNESSHSYDFYIDCSGFNNCITNFINSEWVSFSKYMPCDSVILGEHKLDEVPNHCSIAHAMSNGWMFQIDCEGRTGKGYVYNSSTISEEMAITEYMQKNNFLVEAYRKIKFKSGYYKFPFNKNYCLIGNCAGFAEPLEATGYSVILNSINLIANMHLTKNDSLFLTDSEIKNANMFIEKLWANVINIIVMHYKFNNNYNNDFWKYCEKLNFYGDFEGLIEYMLENKFTLNKSRELNINYLQSVFMPVELVFLFLKMKNIIPKEKINKTDLFNFFNKKSDSVIDYQKMKNDKKYKEYFNKKITLFNFLNS